MRAIVYIRQSFDRTGGGAAVARQLEDCEKLAELRSLTVAGVHRDNDTSAAGKKRRPGFEATLRDLESGRATVVIAWSLDRLTRNRRDTVRLIETCEKAGVTIALVRGADIEMSTPAGRLVADVLAGVARHEIDQKGDRQRRAQQQAAAQGRPAGGRRAFGYASDGITVREAEAPHVRQAFEAILEGRSLKSIAREWNGAGLVTTAGNLWRHDNVREVLKNPRYAGLRTYKGQVVGPAVWPALIDKETHEAVKGLLAAPERRTTSSLARKHLLPGLAFCWKCGSDVATGHTRHGKRVYVCRANKCVSRKADPVDDLVTEVVLERLSRPDAHAFLTAPGVATDEDRAKIDQLERRLGDLTTALEEGILPLASVRASAERLRTEKAALESRVAAVAAHAALVPLLTAPEVRAVWDGLDLRHRREVIETLISVTLERPERARNIFDPASVRIDWK